MAQVMEGALQELRLLLVAGGQAVARAAASISSSNACGGDELTAVLAEHAAALKDLQVRLGYVALFVHHASHDCMHVHVSRYDSLSHAVRKPKLQKPFRRCLS